MGALSLYKFKNWFQISDLRVTNTLMLIALELEVL
jgi:hypothetical protein